MQYIRYKTQQIDCIEPYETFCTYRVYILNPNFIDNSPAVFFFNLPEIDRFLLPTTAYIN